MLITHIGLQPNQTQQTITLRKEYHQKKINAALASCWLRLISMTFSSLSFSSLAIWSFNLACRFQKRCFSHPAPQNPKRNRDQKKRRTKPTSSASVAILSSSLLASSILAFWSASFDFFKNMSRPWQTIWQNITFYCVDSRQNCQELDIDIGKHKIMKHIYRYSVYNIYVFLKSTVQPSPDWPPLVWTNTPNSWWHLRWTTKQVCRRYFWISVFTHNYNNNYYKGIHQYLVRRFFSEAPKSYSKDIVNWHWDVKSEGKRNFLRSKCFKLVVLLMAEFLHQLIGSFSHYL